MKVQYEYLAIFELVKVEEWVFKHEGLPECVDHLLKRVSDQNYFWLD